MDGPRPGRIGGGDQTDEYSSDPLGDLEVLSPFPSKEIETYSQKLKKNGSQS